MSTLGERLHEVMQELGIESPRELAKFCGVTEGLVSQWFSGQTKLGPKPLLAFSRTQFNLEWLLEGKLPKYSLKKISIDTDTEIDTEQAGKPRSVRLVKIKGYAKLGENGYYEELDCDGWVESYSPDPDAYGLRVKGDSMFPAIRNGSVVVIEPGGQIVPGEYVAIALRDGQKMVKELIFDRAEEIVVESVNGNGRRTIARQEIITIHPVAAVVSPSKWRPE